MFLSGNCMTMRMPLKIIFLPLVAPPVFQQGSSDGQRSSVVLSNFPYKRRGVGRSRLAQSSRHSWCWPCVPWLNFINMFVHKHVYGFKLRYVTQLKTFRLAMEKVRVSRVVDERQLSDHVGRFNRPLFFVKQGQGNSTLAGEIMSH